MKMLSTQSFQRLVAQIERLEEEKLVLSQKLKETGNRYQLLKLLVGMKGFEVESVPEIPARPAKPATLALRKITQK